MADVIYCSRRAHHGSLRANRSGVHRPQSLTILHDILLPMADEAAENRPRATVFNPVKQTLSGGETIVEIGCGRGLLSMEMAMLVGPQGRVVSIDSTPDAISAARQNALAAGLDNLEFYLCRVDSIPLPSGLADWIISEGVVSPSSGKMAVFREMFRVLAPGGGIVIHDIAIRKLLPPEIADSVAAFTFGLAGAIELSSYRKLLNATGFSHCEIVETQSISQVELFWDAAAPQPAYRMGAIGLAAPLRTSAGRHWLHEYVAGIRIEARKPLSSATVA
ncbi:MAG: methyltransferase domain-containing protein [Phycisphaerae bacterium]